jgi:hypothetical protein
MKYTFNIILIFYILLFACSDAAEKTTQTGEQPQSDQSLETSLTSENFSCEEMDFESAQDWGEAIKEAYDNASDSTRTDQVEWEKRFFCLFPDNFDGMVTIFGAQGENPGPLYNGGYEIVRFFADLNSIPKDIFYDKFINININGNYQADNIRNGFGITGRFEDDTRNVCVALAKKSDEEIESVFRFIYDSPHPENYRSFFDAVEKIMVKQDPRLTYLNQVAFIKLVEEEHDH